MEDIISKKILQYLKENEINSKIIAYHGTRRQFDKFEPFNPSGAIGNPKGVYFTRDLDTAIEYSMDVDGAVDERSRVIKAQLSIDSEQDGKIIYHSYTGEEIVMFNMDKIVILNDNVL